MSANSPIVTVPLFPELSRRFVTLMEELAPEDWNKPVSPVWRVRDVVAHLLDGSLRRLSIQRDGYQARGAGPATESYPALLEYLNQLNADWARATERLSPRVLIDLIRWSDGELAALLASLDPEDTAIWPVAWAGESQSKNWFDIAREYTEKWHHAQQVFEATGRPSTIFNRELMYPCLDTLMRGLPYALRNCEAPSMTIVRVTVDGACNGEWMAIRSGEKWYLREPEPARYTVSVSLHENIAWRILTTRRTAAEIRSTYKYGYGGISVVGNQQLGDAVLEMVCVMA